MAATHKTVKDEVFTSSLKEWIGRLLHCEKKSGKTFKAKLMAVSGDHLLFENKAGVRMMDSISSLEFIIPIPETAAKEQAQFAADEEYITSWVESETAARRVPTDKEVIEEISRHVSEDEALYLHNEAGYEAEVRARKGL